MSVRLAFATATCVAPEILLLDEWLGAGDALFIAKAKKRMERFVELSTSGARIAFAALLEEWCTHGIWLEFGHVKMMGPVKERIAAYHEATKGVP